MTTIAVHPKQDRPLSAHDRFEAIYMGEAGRVLRYARYRVGIDSAEDVVADTFAVAWQKLDQVPDPAGPWLLATARRVSANQLRARRKQLANRTDIDDFLADPKATGATEQVENRGLLIDALKVLPPIDREAVLLVTWCDLSNSEAASIMHCSVTAFNVRLHRARRRLHRILRGIETQPIKLQEGRT